MPSWFRAPNDPMYPTSEAEADTYWLPRIKDIILLAIAAGLFLVVVLLENDDPREPAPIPATQTNKGTNQ